MVGATLSDGFLIMSIIDRTYSACYWQSNNTPICEYLTVPCCVDGFRKNDSDAEEVVYRVKRLMRNSGCRTRFYNRADLVHQCRSRMSTSSDALTAASSIFCTAAIGDSALDGQVNVPMILTESLDFCPSLDGQLSTPELSIAEICSPYLTLTLYH